ncbi:hypothetical protein L9F63_000772, partial [Diploptera punctata]
RICRHIAREPYTGIFRRGNYRDHHSHYFRNLYTNESADRRNAICKFTRFSNVSQLQSPLRLYSVNSKGKDSSKCKVPGTTKSVDECIPQKVTGPSNPSQRINASKSASSVPPGKTPCENIDMMKDTPQPDCPYDSGPPSKKYIKHIVGGILLLLTSVLAGSSSRGYVDGDHKLSALDLCSKELRRPRVIPKIPASSSDIPKEIPYLLIGGGTASFAAFRAIKSSDPKAKVLVVNNDGYYPYMRPPLSKEMWFNDNPEATSKLVFKQWNGSERSLFYEPDDFYVDCNKLLDQPNGGVAVARGWTIKKLDIYGKKAILEDDTEISYEKCLIATGATPQNLPVFEEASDVIKEKVTLYRGIFDFEELYDIIQNGATSIAIVGGGFLGSELACALARQIRMSNLEDFDHVFESGNMGKVLPEYLSTWTTKKVQNEGVIVVNNTEVEEVEMGKKKLILSLSNGEKVIADQVVVAVGVKPNTDLAESSGLEVDPEYGGFLVNAELMARTNLWMAGDCTCFYDIKLGRRRVEHHDHAVVSGRLAGENMTGAGKPYLHQSMFWSDLGPDVGYEAIGIVDSSLPTVGVFCKATEKDTPKAVVAATDEGNRATTEANNNAEPVSPATSTPDMPKTGEDYGKGVVFYLREDSVVGIVMWNVFNRMSVARQVLKDERKYADLNEVAKLFNIHEQ